MIIFIDDNFTEFNIGGAELSLDTLISTCPYPYKKERSQIVDKMFIDLHKDDFWIIGNCTKLNFIAMQAIKNRIDYVFIENDYKYCIFRNPIIHRWHTHEPCNCEQLGHGINFAEFMQKAKHLFWKSEAQQKFYWNKFPSLFAKKQTIISCNFTDEQIDYMLCRDKPKSDKWAILKSTTAMKGTKEAIEHCKEHNLKYIELYSMPYLQTLDRMAKCKGLVYLPTGYDTCPRLTIEAKLLGLEVVMNENCQQKDEEWFNADIFTMESYLKSRPKVFWEKVGGYVKEKVAI